MQRQFEMSPTEQQPPKMEFQVDKTEVQGMTRFVTALTVIILFTGEPYTFPHQEPGIWVMGLVSLC